MIKGKATTYELILGPLGAKNKFEQAPREPSDLRSHSAWRRRPAYDETGSSRRALVLHARLAPQLFHGAISKRPEIGEYLWRFTVRGPASGKFKRFTDLKSRRRRKLIWSASVP